MKMTHILVQHTVQDFTNWKRFFDQHDSTRRAAGGGDYQLFQDATDPNKVTILLLWDSLENAQRFAASDNLREVMMEAGVVGRPEIHFLTKT
jgi:heme-degrading monooxygenase HmoA